MTGSEPESPCISICVLDDQDICQGCYRSGSEIADWLMVGPEEKWAIVQRAQARRDAVKLCR